MAKVVIERGRGARREEEDGRLVGALREALLVALTRGCEVSREEEEETAGEFPGTPANVFMPRSSARAGTREERGRSGATAAQLARPCPLCPR